MQARLEDDVPHVFIADYAVTIFSLILTTLIVLVTSNLSHSPLFEVFIQLPYEFYPCYHQQTRQQKSNEHQAFLLLPDLDLNVTALLCNVMRKFAE